MTESIFESLEETRVEIIDGGLNISQQGWDDTEARSVFIPGRYVPEFIRELQRVSKSIPAGQEG